MAAIVRMMHRRHGWGLATATGFFAFCLGYGAIANGNSQGAAAPPWFADMTTALLVLFVVSIIAVVVYSVRLRRSPPAVREQAAPIAARHPHGPHSHHYPPRHLVTWVLRWIGMLAILIVAVVSVPAVVDGVAYLAGAERTVTFDPISHQTNCDRYSCQMVTVGILETGGAGTSATWQDVVPLGKPFQVHEPVWRWGLGLALIDSDGTAFIAIGLSLLIEGAAALVVVKMARLALNWHGTGSDRAQRCPCQPPDSAARNAPRAARVDGLVKKIGFLSFGHWSASPGSQTRSGSDALLQSIDLAVAAEELGADGAYFRVHHFARQLGSPFPLLAAVGARTSRIEIGTAVIDMRYENPLYMAEDAGAADLIAGGRLQLGISRGSPEQVIDGWRYFGYQPPEGQTDADMARQHAEVFLGVLSGKGFAQPSPRPMFPNPPGLLRVEPHSEGLRERIWWGAGSQRTAAWAAELGMNLQSSTLINNESDKPFHLQQAEQIQAFRDAWQKAGHEREPRVSVSRSILPLVDDRDRAYFGRRSQDTDEIGFIDPQTQAIFGRTYAAEPDVLISQLKEDQAIAAADTLLVTVPNQLGVDYNAHIIDSILTQVAPALGWR